MGRGGSEQVDQGILFRHKPLGLELVDEAMTEARRHRGGMFLLSPIEEEPGVAAVGVGILEPHPEGPETGMEMRVLDGPSWTLPPLNRLKGQDLDFATVVEFEGERAAAMAGIVHDRGAVHLELGPVLFTASVEDWQAAVRTWKSKVGRNQPCPCGSGSKSKRCCQA